MTPSRIVNDSARAQLEVHWPDTATQVLCHARLRRDCPCAFCRARRQRGEAIEADPAVRITALTPQGYGVQIVFSDGHDRGIYPWAYLRQLAGEGAAKPAAQ